MPYELQPIQDKNYGLANILNVTEIPEYDIEDYDLFDPKQFKQYIDAIERDVRGSMEYREMVQYLRHNMDMNRCAFLNNISNIENPKMKIELHHYPFTLMDITLAVYFKRCAMHEPLDVELVAKEITWLHYYLYIGFVPLAETVHQLIHNGQMGIPLNYVLGRYNDFYNMYEPYITDDTKERYEAYKLISDNYDPFANQKLLEINPVYINIPHGDQVSSYGVPQLEQIVSNVGTRVLELRNNQPKEIEVQPFDIEPEKETTNWIYPFIILED